MFCLKSQNQAFDIDEIFLLCDFKTDKLCGRFNLIGPASFSFAHSFGVVKAVNCLINQGFFIKILSKLLTLTLTSGLYYAHKAP